MKDPRWLIAIAALNLGVAAAAFFGLSAFVLLRVVITAAALATGAGLCMRQDWARRWTIVLWTVCSVLAVPVGVIAGFRQLGAAGAVGALTLAIALPVLIAVYLSQAEIKQAVGSEAPVDSGRRTLAYMLGGFTAGMVLILLMAMALVKAIGQGLR